MIANVQLLTAVGVLAILTSFACGLVAGFGGRVVRGRVRRMKVGSVFAGIGRRILRLDLERDEVI
jgi:hypothetical protein